jgi:hypothetical protein
VSRSDERARRSKLGETRSSHPRGLGGVDFVNVPKRYIVNLQRVHG